MISFGYPRIAVALIIVGAIVGVHLLLAPESFGRWPRLTRARAYLFASLYVIAVVVSGVLWVKMRDRFPVVTYNMELLPSTFEEGRTVDDIKWKSSYHRYLLSVENRPESPVVIDLRSHLEIPDPIIKYEVIGCTGCEGLEVYQPEGRFAEVQFESPSGTNLPAPAYCNFLTINAPKMQPDARATIKLVTATSGTPLGDGYIESFHRHVYYGDYVEDPRTAFVIAVAEPSSRRITVSSIPFPAWRQMIRTMKFKDVITKQEKGFTVQEQP